MMTEPTPGPWQADGTAVFDNRGNCIALTDTGNAPMARMEANAALIAEACNHRLSVLTAVKAALERAAAEIDCTCDGRHEVLTCTDENGRARWNACGMPFCAALEARRIRALDPAEIVAEMEDNP